MDFATQEIWLRVVRCHIIDILVMLGVCANKGSHASCCTSKTNVLLACQHFSNRKELPPPQVMNRIESAAGFERMGRISGKERDVPYLKCFITNATG